MGISGLKASFGIIVLDGVYIWEREDAAGLWSSIRKGRDIFHPKMSLTRFLFLLLGQKELQLESTQMQFLTYLSFL